MNDVYEECPVLENSKYIFRLVEEKDAKDLLSVYSDKNALPFFNSDNCDGDNFYYSTEERMLEAIKFWKWSYDVKAFVRFTIENKIDNNVIGTIELFNRTSEDYFSDCGLMRLDVGSKHENREELREIMSAIIKPAYELFNCSMIATKAAIYAVERVGALKDLGFELSKECLVGSNDKKVYGDYWVIKNGDRL